MADRLMPKKEFVGAMIELYYQACVIRAGDVQKPSGYGDEAFAGQVYGYAG